MIAKAIPHAIVFGYGRCSKNETVQANTRNAQEAAIAQYAAQHLSDLRYEGFFFDPHTSGKTNFFERYAAATLNQRIRRGDHIIVARMCRAFRSTVDGLTTLANLGERGVFLHLPERGITTTGASGKIMLTLLLVLGEWEREMTAERTIAGLAVKTVNGHPCGGTNAPYGWHFAGRKRNRRYEYDQEERDYCQRLLDWDSTMSAGRMRERLIADNLLFRGTIPCVPKLWKMIKAARLGFPLPNGKTYAGK